MVYAAREHVTACYAADPYRRAVLAGIACATTPQAPSAHEIVQGREERITFLICAHTDAYGIFEAGIT